MPAKKKQNSNSKKVLIIFAIIIASLLTVGSALAYYNFQKENLVQDRPMLKRQLINQKRQAQKNRLPQGLLKGEVAGKSDNMLILNANDEEWKVNLSDKTRYRENGHKITRDDVVIGDQISVFGKKDIKNKSVEAILIRKINSR
ncbi:MAG: hypothetical protein Q8P54_01070 [bacterium]|nr:hypothetical protein [bacterium]